MTAAHQARRLAQRFGVDLQRWPQSDPAHYLGTLFRHHGIDLVVDVGANNGGYATTVRRHGYAGPILSFEPLTGPFAELQARSAQDASWEAMRYAIGAEEGTVTINVAGNAGASSSVLPMLDEHRSAAPTSTYVGTEEVPLHRLDEVLPGMSGDASRVFLKVDVQGYEAAVLDGASGLLDDGLIVGLQLELSFTPLYDGAMTWREGLDRAAAAGMRVEHVLPGFTNQETGQMLQADVVFFRSADS